jgi:superfamily II DNA helicase RecQ
MHRSNNSNDGIDDYVRITNEAMNDVFGFSPRPFQQQIIPHIIRMSNINPCHPTMPTLLVHGTGGGKSSVYQTIGVIKGNISLIIQNTLSLSSDQLSKLSPLAQHSVVSVQLDATKSVANRNELYDYLTNSRYPPHHSIFIFASPEALDIPIWKKMIDVFTYQKQLSLVCVDEVHLFVEYAITFRPSFLKLKAILFDKIKAFLNNGSTICVPCLFMTATFNNELKTLLQQMTGLFITPPNTFWSDEASFQRRNIRLDVIVSNYKMKYIKNAIERTLGGNLTKKMIIYSNVARRVETIREETDSWLDSNPSIDGDTIVINGDLEAEWKFVSSRKFTTKVANPKKMIDDNKYFPRILIATSGCIGAGLDCSDVYSVIRDGMPTSVLNFVQEMGRCGRGRVVSADSNYFSDNYTVIVSLSSVVYLFERIYTKSSYTDKEKESIEEIMKLESIQKYELNKILSVLKLLFLKVGCWHKYLESSLAIDDTNQIQNHEDIDSHSSPMTCANGCPSCIGSGTLPHAMPISKQGIIEFLIDTFISSRSSDIRPIDVVRRLKEYPNVSTNVYGLKRSTPPQSKFLEVTVMQLLASKLIDLYFDTNNNDDAIAYVKLGVINSNEVNGTTTISYMIDDVWNNIDCI